MATSTKLLIFQQDTLDEEEYLFILENDLHEEKLEMKLPLLLNLQLHCRMKYYNGLWNSKMLPKEK